MSVSLDFHQAMWEKAILDDSLEWTYHVSDLKGWKNEAAVLYNIKSIPACFLIDGEGTIIAMNLRADDLESKLKKLQLQLINKHKTTELITDSQLWFHPDDFEKKLTKKFTSP